MEREGFTRAEGTRDFEKTVIKQSTATRIEIVINGKPVHVSQGEALSRELLQRVSAEVDLPVDVLAPLLARARSEAGTLDTVAGVQPARATGPLRRVQCPGCERAVSNRQGWCVYCGHELVTDSAPTGTSPVKELDEVDRQVLETDIVPSEDTDQQHDQVRNSFRDRLEGL